MYVSMWDMRKFVVFVVRSVMEILRLFGLNFRIVFVVDKLFFIIKVCIIFSLLGLFGFVSL